MAGGPNRARHRFGIVGDLLIGIGGAFIGSWLLSQLGLHLGSGIVLAVINATIGASWLIVQNDIQQCGVEFYFRTTLDW